MNVPQNVLINYFLIFKVVQHNQPCITQRPHTSHLPNQGKGAKRVMNVNSPKVEWIMISIYI